MESMMGPRFVPTASICCLKQAACRPTSLVLSVALLLMGSDPWLNKKGRPPFSLSRHAMSHN